MLVCLVVCCPVCAWGEESGSDQPVLPQEVADLADQGQQAQNLWQQGAGEVLQSLWQQFSGKVTQPLQLFLRMGLLLVFAAVAAAPASGGDRPFLPLVETVCFLACAGLCIQPLQQLAEQTRQQILACKSLLLGSVPVLASVLRGSYIFMADLTRAIDLPVTVDFMAVSSYGAGTKSSGQVEIKKDLSDSIEGRDLIIVEDILDSGNTLYYLMEILRARKPASIRICTLMDKPDRRTKPIVADYVGFTIPDAFVVGYGLDYDEKYRNLPYVGILKPSVYGGE